MKQLTAEQEKVWDRLKQVNMPYPMGSLNMATKSYADAQQALGRALRNSMNVTVKFNAKTKVIELNNVQ